MADVDLDRRSDVGTRADRQMRAKIVHGTETRRSLMTSEFWLALAAAAAVVIAGYVADADLAAERAWTLATAIMVAYIVSRGIAKAGSRDTVVRDYD